MQCWHGRDVPAAWKPAPASAATVEESPKRKQPKRGPAAAAESSSSEEDSNQEEEDDGEESSEEQSGAEEDAEITREQLIFQVTAPELTELLVNCFRLYMHCNINCTLLLHHRYIVYPPFVHC